MMHTPPPHLPSSPWVYKFFDHKGQLLYVGKAKSIMKRVQQYFSPGSLWKQEMVSAAARIERIETPSEADALLLEDNLIKQHLPEYNKLLRNNSSYVFLKISKGPFPTFRIVKKRTKDGSTYIWPRYNTKQLWQLLRYLRQVFKFHTMKPLEFGKWVLHSDYFFWLDKWRSVIALLNDPKKEVLIAQAKYQWRKQEKSYEQYVNDYKKITQIVSNCFEWRTWPVLTVLEKEMQLAISNEYFERCVTLRDIYQFVSSLDKTYQHIVLKKPLIWYIGKIELVADAWVILLIQVTEGKIVDIIRTHKTASEHTINDLAATLYAEFDCTATLEQQDTLQIVATPSLARLTKKERSSLDELFATAQKSYLQSTAHLSQDNLMEQLLVELQTSYDLSRIPLHMECIDISHLSGSNISGGLSCFRGWLPDKMHYRQYKIQTVEKGSSHDYQSLKEVIIRRCKLTKDAIWTQLLPDLLIIDGGKGQLGIIRELAKEYPSIHILLRQVDIIALGKGEARQRSKKLAWAPELIYKFWPDRTIIEYPVLYTHADQLMINCRDEAHRFANRYRKKQAEKEWK